MPTFLRNVAAVVVGGFFLGMILDEMGQGKLGSFPRNLALKSTRGFGTAS